METCRKFHVKAQNLELAVDRYMHPRMTGRIACLLLDDRCSFYQSCMTGELSVHASNHAGECMAGGCTWRYRQTQYVLLMERKQLLYL